MYYMSLNFYLDYLKQLGLAWLVCKMNVFSACINGVCKPRLTQSNVVLLSTWDCLLTSKTKENSFFEEIKRLRSRHTSVKVKFRCVPFRAIQSIKSAPNTVLIKMSYITPLNWQQQTLTQKDDMKSKFVFASRIFEWKKIFFLAT